MVKFRCPSCAQKLSTRDDRAGKGARCPRCKEQITVPCQPARDPVLVLDDGLTLIKPVTPPDVAAQELVERQRLEKEIARAREEDEQLLASLGAVPPPAPEQTGERTQPWLIDILLYPATGSGIVHLVIFSFFGMLGRSTLQPLYWHSPPIMHLAFVVIVGGYCLFYLAGCIRNSAGGEHRAPDVNRLPEQLSTDAILSQLFATFVWAAFCVGPALACIIAGRTDHLLWLLVGYTAVYGPIALLAVVLFDSVRALSPVLILPSILSVLVPYVLLVLACCLVFGLLIVLYLHVAFGSVLCAYLLMVMAHILGRFYLRYEDRLNWEA